MLLLDDRERVREETARMDRERLQGRWISVGGRRAAELQIDGDRYVVRFRNGDLYTGTLTLDPTHRPTEMDMWIEEGPEHHRGKMALAIYHIDGDHLIWSPAEPGCEVRFQAFPPDDDLEHLCLIFRRS